MTLELTDLDLVSGQLRVRRGKGRKPRPVALSVSALPALQDSLEVRSSEPGPLFCAVLKNGRLVRDPQGQLQGMSGSAVWAICQERGRKARIQPPPPTICAGPGLAICSRPGWTWPRAEDGGPCFGLDDGAVRSPAAPLSPFGWPVHGGRQAMIHAVREGAPGSFAGGPDSPATS